MWRLAKQLGKRLMPQRWHPQPYLIRRILKDSEMTVHSGPFQAMKYAETTVGSVLLPKILGVYEKELHPIIERACALDFQTIVNIGAGEGYYAVGMARRSPGARVLAFEMDERGRIAMERLARLNGVSGQVTIRGVCTTADLAGVLSSGRRTLVICDVEGAELSLLDPVEVGGLRSCHILVELHEFVFPGVSDTLRERFSASHRIQTIWQEDRTRRDYPSRALYASLLPEHYLQTVMHERRPQRMSWFWMNPHGDRR